MRCYLEKGETKKLSNGRIDETVLVATSLNKRKKYFLCNVRSQIDIR